MGILLRKTRVFRTSLTLILLGATGVACGGLLRRCSIPLADFHLLGNFFKVMFLSIKIYVSNLFIILIADYEIRRIRNCEFKVKR